MAAPVQGVGSLIVADVLTDISYSLFEPCVNVIFPAATAAGAQTVNVYDPSMYVGAQILAGVLGVNLEVVTITAVVVGTSFSAVFVNPHPLADPIYGPTFPVQSVAGDPFWTQLQMLTYLSNALNDLLLRVPLVYAIDDSIVVQPTNQYTPLPTDCMLPVRISAFGIGLRETSQSNLDGTDFRWMQQYEAEPYCYYRDKIGLQNFGIWPRADNRTPVEVIYEQRGPQLLGMADGFPIPDPFTVYLKARVLEFAYSGDSEQRSPALASFWNGRYEAGVKIASMILEVIEDTSMQ